MGQTRLHLKLLLFGAECRVLLPDQLLQLSDQQLRLAQPLRHFLHGHLAAAAACSAARRAWTLLGGAVYEMNGTEVKDNGGFKRGEVLPSFTSSCSWLEVQ